MTPTQSDKDCYQKAHKAYCDTLATVFSHNVACDPHTEATSAAAAVIAEHVTKEKYRDDRANQGYNTVKAEVMSEIRACLLIGLEHARSALIEHDTNLGRTTRKNIAWAEVLEQDIAKMESLVNELNVWFGP